MELSCIDFKITTVNMFKELKDKIQKFDKELETIEMNQVKILVQAYLRDTANLVLDHCNKTNISIKRIT